MTYWVRRNAGFLFAIYLAANVAYAFASVVTFQAIMVALFVAAFVVITRG